MNYEMEIIIADEHNLIPYSSQYRPSPASLKGKSCRFCSNISISVKLLSRIIFVPLTYPSYQWYMDVLCSIFVFIRSPTTHLHYEMVIVHQSSCPDRWLTDTWSAITYVILSIHIRPIPLKVLLIIAKWFVLGLPRYNDDSETLRCAKVGAVLLMKTHRS